MPSIECIKNIKPAPNWDDILSFYTFMNEDDALELYPDGRGYNPNDFCEVEIIGGLDDAFSFGEFTLCSHWDNFSCESDYARGEMIIERRSLEEWGFEFYNEEWEVLGDDVLLISFECR